MKALNNETDAYEDTSDYQSVESLHNNSYYDHSPTEFYPMIPEQKYRPPVDNIYRSMYTIVCLMGWCLTPLSTIFLLYRGVGILHSFLIW